MEEINEVNNRRFHTLFSRVRNLARPIYELFPPVPTQKSSHDCIHRWTRRSVYHLGEMPCTDHPCKSLRNFERTGRKHEIPFGIFSNFRLSARVWNCSRWDEFLSRWVEFNVFFFYISSSFHLFNTLSIFLVFSTENTNSTLMQLSLKVDLHILVLINKLIFLQLWRLLWQWKIYN